MRLKSQEDLAGGGGEHRGLLQSDLSGSKPRPYAMKTETNRCASAGLLRFGRRRHHAFRCDLSGDSDLDYSYRHWSCNRRWCRAQGARCPRWNIAANIVIAGSLHSERTVNPAGYAKPEELDADRAINEDALDNAINDLSI